MFQDGKPNTLKGYRRYTCISCKPLKIYIEVSLKGHPVWDLMFHIIFTYGSHNKMEARGKPNASPTEKVRQGCYNSDHEQGSRVQGVDSDTITRSLFTLEEALFVLELQ